MLEFLTTMFLTILVLVIYFLPGIIALHRWHNNGTPILVCNLFLGWTFLGWVGSLIWSLTDNVKERKGRDDKKAYY